MYENIIRICKIIFFNHIHKLIHEYISFISMCYKYNFLCCQLVKKYFTLRIYHNIVFQYYYSIKYCYM